MKSVLKLIFYQWAFLLVEFSCMRFLFFVVYFDAFKAHSASQIAGSFLHGIKFDISVLCTLYGLLHIVWLGCANFIRTKWLAIFFTTLGYVFLLYIIIIQTADLVLYEEIGRRLSFEWLYIENDVSAVGATVLKEYLWAFAGSVVCLLLVSLGWWWLFIVWNISKPDIQKPFKWWVMPPAVVLAFLLTVIGIRGGVQEKPVLESFAFRSPALELGHLTLNSPFTALRQLFVRQPTSIGITLNSADVKLARKLVMTSERQQFPDSNFPFYRKRLKVTEDELSMNVVLIVLEGLSSGLVGVQGNPDNLTPELDELSKKGLLFDNFYASGTRSIEGIASILLSLPAFENFKFLENTFEQNNMLPLSYLFKQKGYQNLFIHGNFANSLGMHALARRSGFDKVFAQEDFENYTQISDSVWGIWDEFQYAKLIQELEGLKPPFLGMVFTTTNHTPYEVPSHFEQKLSGEPWQQVVRYSDWALGQFFEQAQQQDWYSNTLFVITSDHTSHSYRSANRNDKAKVPLVLFTPNGLLQAGVNHRLSSQIDILPTLLDLFNWEIAHASMGKSMLAETEESFAIFMSGHTTWWKESKGYQFKDEKLLGAYDNFTDPDFLQPLDTPDPQAVEEYNAWRKTVRWTVFQNKIAPKVTVQLD